MEHRVISQHRFFPYLWGIAAPAIGTLIDWPFRNILAPANMLMVYLLGVVLVASRFGRWPAVLASVLSAPAFAFFYAPPIFSLAMKDLENIVGLGAMLVTAHVTSQLLERMRMQADIAANRERRAKALYRLSEALSGARSDVEVASVSVRHLHAELGVRSVLLWPEAEGHLARPKGPPLSESLRGIDLDEARRVYERHPVAFRPREDGIGWFPLMGSEGPLGLLGVEEPPPGAITDREERTFLDMLLNQITQSLERLRLAEQARESTLQADTETFRNSLLSAISHDLRTPLTRIVGTASTLAEQDETLTPVERKEFTKAIQEEAQHMADLMTKILDMARITSGKINLQWEWSAIEEIVGAALTRLDSLLHGRPVHIHLPEPLPLVRIDAVLIQQVLMNLIENAVKYSPAGSPIEIAAAWTPAALRLAVADRGPGFPEDIRDRLFEKFYRLAPESAESGVGLGLALCRAIALAHGGEIEARNRPEGGALFSLTLPLHEPPPALDWQETPEAEA